MKYKSPLPGTESLRPLRINLCGLLYNSTDLEPLSL